MIRRFTVLAFTVSIALDWLTSLILLSMGYVEQNPVYGLLGSWFWLLYLTVNAGILVLLLAASERWWWTYLILWIPTSVHLICGVHNLGLF